MELEEEISKIKWDIVGLGDVRRRGEQQIGLKLGNTLYLKGNEDRPMGGVGFMIHKKHVNNIAHFESVSTRVSIVI